MYPLLMFETVGGGAAGTRVGGTLASDLSLGLTSTRENESIHGY